VTRLRPVLARLAPFAALGLLVLLVAACVPGVGGPGGSGGPTPSHSQAPLTPASPSADPVSLFAWLFTPIFQALFILLTFLDQVTNNMAISIILMTIVLRVAVVPLYRRQLTSSRQMQLLQPEVKELQRKHKGDRMKQQAAVQEFYRQRGINPAGGCLPILLQFGLLLPMYSVISQGLTNYDPSAMWHVFGINLFPGITCPTAPIFNAAGHVTNPCLDPVAWGIDWSLQEPVTTGFYIAGFGISILAIISSLLQLIASRMTLPQTDPKNDDPNIRIQRQMAYFLPFISVLYGGILPAGLFLYWITSTVIQIVQQYLILGWGGMFPLFGWYPGFAREHKPRYPVKLPEVKPPPPGQSSSAAERSKAVDRDLSARQTVRPNRSRNARRGRRR
jgi:YidC/Oxa1 family membrane protein insertase